MQAAWPAVITSLTVSRPEGPRHCLMAVPNRQTPGKHPLVILLHGHGGSAAQIMGQGSNIAPLSMWLRIADREQVLLAAPDGTQGRNGKEGWNDCRADARTNPKTDDVGLISDIINAAIADNDADPERIYVMGMSNGGIMAFRLAIEMGARLAGIATMGAAMPAHSACGPLQTPISALIVAGTADPVMPYAGGQISFTLGTSRGTVLSMEESAVMWRTLDGMYDTARPVELAHRNAADLTRSTRYVWGQERDQLQVEFVRIEHGGHVEPSIARHVGKLHVEKLGPQSSDFEMAEEAWSFFEDKRAGLKRPTQ
jgi:polyhydroxybutyrate depolymerase